MTQPILNAYCLERQKRALESQAKSRASGIDSKRAEQQAQYILKHHANSKTKRASRHNNESIRVFESVSEDPFKDRFEIHLRNR